MNLSIFTDGLQELASRSPLLPSDCHDAAIIINPRAGGFSHKKRYAAALATLSNHGAASSGLQARELRCRVRFTEYPKHASRMAEELLDEAAASPGKTWFVMLASGDGTSLEFLDPLSRAPRELRERFIVLRLPMGTGNDGSDGRTLEESFSRLMGAGTIATQCVLQVIPAKGGPAQAATAGGEWRSFNIASLGLDAFVTHQTNKLKSSLPGDFYKLWLDVASILYDKIYPPGLMTLVGRDGKGQETFRYTGTLLLAAMGVSGRRTYGSNKPILPDQDNVCAIKQMSLLKKIALKGPISSGKHRDLPVALLFSAESLEIHYDRPILVQMDGEAHELGAQDFPLVFKKTEPLVRHIGRAEQQ